MMRRLAFAVALATTGCFAAVTWEDFTKGNDRAIDARGDASSSSGSSGSAEAGPGLTDASSSSGAVLEAGADTGSPTLTCAPGARIFGKLAYDATPIAAGADEGLACDVDAVLAEDDDWAGVDRGAKETVIDGQDVCGCIGIELAAPTRLNQVQVRTGPSNDACGKTKCGNGQCNTGHSLIVFVGPNRDTLHFVDVFNDVDAVKTLTTKAVGNDPVSVIVACHEPWSSGRDDMIVDFLAGVCP